MKKKPPLEADLDPTGNRHTRPGSKIAESAVANAKKARKRKQCQALRPRRAPARRPPLARSMRPAARAGRK